MTPCTTRDSVWSRLADPWDVMILGGGIVGAGLLREAARAGLRTLLVEAGDFASGTSSRSSKMVHGGFRYLATGQVKLTMESVWERQRLLREARGLVDPLEILLVHRHGDSPPAWMIGAGLIVYDVLAGRWQHVRKSKDGVRKLCPFLADDFVAGGFRFFDAVTDDARLVLRVLQEGIRAGGCALNYARAERLLRDQSGRVCGAAIRDQVGQRNFEVRATVVINATGAWADDLRGQIGRRPRLRRLRGAHLVFPRGKFPLKRQITLQHPKDRRFILLFPWEGATLVGNTDLDHRAPMETDLAILPSETEYLMTAVRAAFAPLGLSESDILSTQAGIRSVLDTGKANPSQESRDEVLWDEDGLVTITGGKLTTFRRMAQDTLASARARLPGHPRPTLRARALDPLEKGEFTALARQHNLEASVQTRLLGRFGQAAADLLSSARTEDLQPAGGSPTLWAELRWSARAEAAVHLEDVLLRRTRLGLLLPEGGAAEEPRIRSLVQMEMGWDDMRWREEWRAYRDLWGRAYAPPGYNPQEQP